MVGRKGTGFLVAFFLPILSIPFHPIPSPNSQPSNNVSFVTMGYLLIHSLLPSVSIVSIICDIK